MRREDIKKLSEPYTHEKGNLDRRFNSAVGADIPSAHKLAEEIFSDIDPNVLGIGWWQGTSAEERILIGDYLYQCVNGIETNMVEAKLHFMEWASALEEDNKLIADVIKRKPDGDYGVKMPPSKSALDDLPARLLNLHACGFLRAIGSSLDCLGAAIIGVLALPTSLRRSDITRAIKALPKTNPSNDPGIQIQTEFKSFFEDVKRSCGTRDWLEWADQYRNMYVHRGRRTTHHQIIPRKNRLYDAQDNWIPRADTAIHLAKYPDRTDIEAFIKSSDINLDEDAETTLSGIFGSCRNLNEIVCERLVSIWIERRGNPSLLEQPASQWDDKIRECNFTGYDASAEPLTADTGITNPNLRKRMLAASVFDKFRSFWDNSKWKK